MIKKISILLLACIGFLALLAFESTIGMPIVYTLLALQLIHDQDGYKKVFYCTIVSVLLALSIHNSITVVFLLFVAATYVLEYSKQKNILYTMTFASILVCLALFNSEVRLIPLSFVYFFSVLVVVITAMNFQTIRQKAKMRVYT